jgi:DNA primase
VKKEPVVEFLKAVGAAVPQHQPRNGWVISDCPLGPWKHKEGKSAPTVFGARLDDGVCKCFACGWAGQPFDLLLDLKRLVKLTGKGAINFKAAMDAVLTLDEESEFEPKWQTLDQRLAVTKKELHEFPAWWLDSFPFWSQISAAVAYLGERNVYAEVADFLDLRFDTTEKRVCFPVHDFSGKLMGLHGRAIQKGVEPRYRMYTQGGENNPIIWLGERWVDPDYPIVVVEGPFDLAAVMAVYPNVVTPLFSNPSFDKIRRMAHVKEWVTFLDRGAGGDAGREKIDLVLGGDHSISHVLPIDGSKDPAEMTRESIKHVLQKVLPESLLTVD